MSSRVIHSIIKPLWQQRQLPSTTTIRHWHFATAATVSLVINSCHTSLHAISPPLFLRSHSPLHHLLSPLFPLLPTSSASSPCLVFLSDYSWQVDGNSSGCQQSCVSANWPTVSMAPTIDSRRRVCGVSTVISSRLLLLLPL